MADNPLGFAHGASAYRNHLCRCRVCKAAHNEECKAYAKASRASARSMKLELAELRAFKARMVAAFDEQVST